METESKVKMEKKDKEKIKKIEKEDITKVETTEKEKKVEEKKKEAAKLSKEKSKKTEALINVENLPISTKHSIAICKFIKNKKIETAISDLEQVLRLKKPVPMKGEIPHRKGKGIMSGKFPKKATLRFIVLLKSLAANSNYNGLENPIITKAIANIGSRPYGRFGWVRKKRSHVKIIAKERNITKKNSNTPKEPSHKKNTHHDTHRVKEIKK